jgi:hypothetical protein
VSGTRRTPLDRPAVAQVSPGAVDLYIAMSKLWCTCPSPRPPEVGPCPGCAKWYDLHDELDDELQCEPWEWPIVARQSPKRAGSPAMNEGIAARMAMLRAATKARRTASSKEGTSDVDLDNTGEDEPVS